MSITWEDVGTTAVEEPVKMAWPDVGHPVEEKKSLSWADVGTEDTGQGLAASMGNSLGGGFEGGLGSTVEGVGDIASIFVGDNPVQSLGQSIKADSAERFPINPANADKFAVKASGVVGQVAEQVAEAVTGVGVLKAVKGAKNVLNTGRTLALGGAFLKGADAGEDVAKQYGITGDGARAAAILGMGAIEAGTEAIGGLGGHGPLTGGGLKAFLKTAGAEGGEEVAAGILGDTLTRTLAPSGEPGKAANGAPLPNPLDVGKRAEEFALGAVGGGVFGLPQLIGGSAPQSRQTPDSSPQPKESAAPPANPVEAEVPNYANQQREALKVAATAAATVDVGTEQQVKEIAALAGTPVEKTPPPTNEPNNQTTLPPESGDGPNMPESRILPVVQEEQGAQTPQADVQEPAGQPTDILPGYTIHGKLSSGRISVTRNGESTRSSFTVSEIKKEFGEEAAYRIRREVPTIDRKLKARSTASRTFRENPFIEFLLKEVGRMKKPEGTEAPTFHNKGLIHPTHQTIWGGEMDPGKAAQAAYEANWISEPDVGLLYEKISEASRGANSKSYESHVATQEQQFQDFHSAVQSGETKVHAQELTVGSTLEIEGEIVKVKAVNTDEDGNVLSVDLQDGTRFGLQSIAGDESIFVENADIKPFEDIPWGEEETSPEIDAKNSVNSEQSKQSEPGIDPFRQDFLSGTQDDPFNLVSETTEERKAREAKEAKAEKAKHDAEVARLKAEAEKLQRSLFDNNKDQPKVEKTVGSNVTKKRWDKKYIDQIRPTISQMLRSSENASNVITKAAGRKLTSEQEIDVVVEWVQQLKEQGEPVLPVDFAILSMDQAYLVEPAIKNLGLLNPLFDDAMNGSDAAFDQLDSDKETYHGAPPKGRPGESRGPRFSSPAEFQAAFEAAFARNDFDAALDAVKAADRSLYAGYMRQLYKAANSGDAVAKNKVEWFRHIFNGIRPPGVAAAPQTPPPPQAGPTPQQSAPPPPPAPPPQPIPPKPSGKMSFNVAAMIHLATQLNTNVRIQQLLRAARGRATGSRSTSGAAAALVELHKHIFKDPQQAAKTLAHEIGHVIDWVFRSLPRSNLAAKVAPLKNWQAIFGNLWDWTGKKMPPINAILKSEAVTLSTIWRGPFTADNHYRNSASELYADFLSAILNDPNFAYQVAPNLTAAFFAGLQQKPEVEKAYNLTLHLLTTDTLLSTLQAQASTAGTAAVRAAVAEAEDKAHGKRQFRRALTAIYGSILNRHGILAMKSGGYWTSMKNRMLNFGTDYVTKQEAAEQFANRRTAQLEHDLYHGVDKLIEAEGIGHDNLATYLKNYRIINEKTSTGQWVRNNPDEARALFIWMAQTSGLTEFESQFANAADADLYDLGAKFIWKLHEQAKFDSVMSAGQRVGAPKFVAQALTAFDVSGFMLNPQGITPETAVAQNDMIAKDIGPQKYARLEELAAEHHRLIADVMREAFDLGLIDPKLWNERIQPNLDSYVPFMVLEYFQPKTTAAFYKRVGTAKNILPAQVASKMKALAMIRRMQWQQVALNVKEHFEVEGPRYGFANEMQIHDELTDDQKNQIQRDGGGVIGFWRNGKYIHMALKDGQIVEAMAELQLGELGTPIFKLARTVNNFWRMWFTTYSIGFSIRNTIRSFRSLAEAVGTQGLGESRKLRSLAKAYADASFGAEWTPEVRDMVSRGLLPVPDRHILGDLTTDELADMILRGTASTDQISRGLPGTRATKWIHKYVPPLGRLLDGLAYFSAYMESLPKIAAERTYLTKGFTPAEALALAKLEAIPNPGTKAGKYSQAMDTVLMFYRVVIQGARRSRTLLSNPKTRGGYTLRLAISYGLMKSFYVLAGAGIIDALFGGDGDDKQKDYEEWIKRTTPYKLEQDDVLFLGWLDGDGNYHAPFGHPEIPAEWTPVSFRIPAGEEGRHLGPLTATALSTLVNSPIRPVDPAQRIAESLIGMLPSWTPTKEVVGNWADITKSKPPQDNYRGRPIVSQDEWDAGYGERAWGMTKYTLASLNIDAAKPDVIANKSLPTWISAVKSTPVAGTAFNALFATDNYAGVRESQRDRAEATQVNAKARLARGNATIQASRQLEMLEKKGKAGRSTLEEDKYQRLRRWDREYYNGTKAAPGLFKIMKAAAAGDKNVDGKYAAERLEETAKAVLQ